MVESETFHSVSSVGQACLDRRERSSVEQDDGNRKYDTNNDNRTMIAGTGM